MSRDYNPASTQVPRLARFTVAILFFLNGTIFASWVTRLPTVQAKLMLSTGELGVALLGISVGALIGMNLSGYLAARFGSRSVTTIASVSLCVMLPMLALAPTLPILVTALVLSGACNGSMDVAMNAQGVAVERCYGRPILNSFHASFSLGGLTGAFVGGLAASHGIALLPHFLGIAIFCFILTILTARFLLPAHVDARRTSAAFVRPTRALLVLGLVAFCVVFGESTIAGWSAIYLLETFHTDAGLAAAGYAAFSVAMACGRGLGDQLAARLGPLAVVRLGGLVAAIGLTIALVIIWVPVAILGFALVGAGFSVVFPLTLSAAGNTSKQASGTSIAVVSTCGSVGSLVGPPLIGFAAVALSLRIALGFVVILSLLAAAIAYTMSSDKHAKKGGAPKTIERPEPSIPY